MKHELVNIAIGLTSLIVILLVFLGPWQKLMVERCRQKLFKIRDDIFDLAIRDDFNYSTKEYKEIRDYLNKLIRYCFVPTLLRLWVSSKLHKEELKHYKNPLAELVKNIHDKKLKKILSDYLYEGVKNITICTYVRNPFVTAVIIISLPIVTLIDRHRRIKKLLIPLLKWSSSIIKEINYEVKHSKS